VITWAFVRIVPSRSTTKPEPWEPTPPKYENTVTTPGERAAKIRAAENPAVRDASFTVTVRGGACSTTVVVCAANSPAARPIPSAASPPATAQTSAKTGRRTGRLYRRPFSRGNARLPT